MKRNSSFKEGIQKPVKIIDSRFGLRKMFLNSQEKPSIAINGLPGKGVNGEHQN